MTINKKALILAFLSALTVEKGEFLLAQSHSWYWNSPRQTVNTTIVEADDGLFILNANIGYLENGELIAFNEHSFDDRDTNVNSVTIQWHRSNDGGNTWIDTQRPPGFPDIESRLATLPLRFADPTLLTVGSYAWENHPLHPQFGN